MTVCNGLHIKHPTGRVITWLSQVNAAGIRLFTFVIDLTKVFSSLLLCVLLVVFYFYAELVSFVKTFYNENNVETDWTFVLFYCNDDEQDFSKTIRDI